FAHMADQVPDLPARLRIETGGELVQDGHPGAADEREGDREALLLAAAERAELLIEEIGQSETFGQLRPGLGIVVEGRPQPQGLAGGDLRLRAALLRLDADEAGDPLSVRERVAAVHSHSPAVRGAEPGDHLPCGGLPGTVRAEDPEDLS